MTMPLSPRLTAYTHSETDPRESVPDGSGCVILSFRQGDLSLWDWDEPHNLRGPEGPGCSEICCEDCYLGICHQAWGQCSVYGGCHDCPHGPACPDTLGPGILIFWLSHEISRIYWV